MAKKKNENRLHAVLGATRIGLGLIFLWAFFDKLIGLGFATCRNPETNSVEVMCSNAWLEGGSPTFGFLKFGTEGPFADFYQGLASSNPNSLVNWLFMIGLLGIGTALVLGIGIKIAAISGALMMIMMWSAYLPPDHHPFLDDHVIYALVLIALMYANDSQKFGIRDWWLKQNLVKKYSVLE